MSKLLKNLSPTIAALRSLPKKTMVNTMKRKKLKRRRNSKSGNTMTKKMKPPKKMTL